MTTTLVLMYYIFGTETQLRNICQNAYFTPINEEVEPICSEYWEDFNF